MKPDEILKGLVKLTPAQSDRINAICAKEAEDLTYEDLELYAQWHTANEVANMRFEAEREARMMEAQAAIEDAHALNKAAIANLEAHETEARARLDECKARAEVIRNRGTQEQK